MRLFLFFSALMLCSLGTASAQALMLSKVIPCMPSEFLIRELKAQYNETIVFSYSNDNEEQKTAIEMFENTQTGTWTLLERKEKVACVLAAGKRGKQI